MSRRWRTFRRISWRERVLLANAMVSLTVVWLGVRIAGYGRTRSVVSQGHYFSQSRRTAEQVDALLHSLAWSVAASASIAPRATTCLDRTLTLWWLLRRRAVNSDLRIGVAQTADGVMAHAWLEKDGVVLNDSGEVTGKFAAFDDLH